MREINQYQLLQKFCGQFLRENTSHFLFLTKLEFFAEQTRSWKRLHTIKSYLCQIEKYSMILIYVEILV